MYAVITTQNNRVVYVKVFSNFDDAVRYADETVMDLGGVSNEMPDWENHEVYEYDGYGTGTVMVSLVSVEVAEDDFNSNKIHVNKNWYYKSNNKKYGDYK